MCGARFFMLLAALLPCAPGLRVTLANAKERPVMKVVRMLQDMKVELQKDLDDDKAVHEMLDCWCDTNEKEKTQAIELATAKISQLEASMGEATARIAELKVKRASTREELASDQKALDTARALRMKENKLFHSEETDLLSAIASCQQAIVVLSEHHPELAQVRSVAQKLLDAKVPQLMLASGALRKEQLDALRFFTSGAQVATAFLDIPGFQSYAPQSGQVFGILKQMHEDFKSSLAESQKSEAKAVEEFEALKAAKEDEIAAGKKAVVQIDADLAELMEKHAQATQQLEDTKDQLALDTEFMLNLKKKCSVSDEEFDIRMKSRLEEITAVDDTIVILNSDESFDVFDKTVNTDFLQTRATAGQEKQQRLRRAASVLRAAAARNGPAATQLSALAIAASAQLDAFTKVKEEIDRLVTELNQQQKDEVAHKDECTKEMDTNTRSTAAADDKKTSLVTKVADLESTIKQLTADIGIAKAAIVEMQKQMKSASETREADAAEAQQTIMDQRMTQNILNKALTRMKQVYALMQEQPGAPHIQMEGTDTDPGNGPAAFKDNASKNAGGNRVVAMLQEVIADSHKTEDEAIAAEEDAQTAYENFMKESNKSIVENTKSIVNMSESKAKTKESLSMAKTDLTQTVLQLESLSKTLGDLHKACDYILNNFDARQEARAAEVEALREAKAILSGMK